MLLTCTACGNGVPAESVISRPAPNASFQAGEEIEIEGRVSGSGIRRADVYVNGKLYAAVDQPAAENVFEVSLKLVALEDMIGMNVIQLKGVNAEEMPVVSSEPLFIMIVPPPSPTPLPTAAPPSPTAPPSEPVATPTVAPVLLSTKGDLDFVNVRAQPNINAQLLGQINRGQSVTVIGKSADGQWVQVSFAASPSGSGWVFAQVATITGDLGSVPVTGGQTTPAPSAAVQLQPPFVRLKPDQPFANVRSGPDVGFQRLGQLDTTQPAARVKGKNAAATWWQIEFPGAPDNTAWVFGQLVDLIGDFNAVPVVQSPPAPGSQAPTPTPPAPPTATPLPASALLPYSQSMTFAPRDNIGDVPLGHNGESKTARLQWNITGAVRAELDIQTQPGPGIFSNCPAGNLAAITPNDAAGKRIPLSLPSGEYEFTITERGYYLFTIYVVKSDGSTTTIPRNVIVDCYKTQ